MILQTLTFQPDQYFSMCTICVTDNSGGKIALLIIISSLILMGVANWVWNKYFSNKDEISQEK